MRDRAKRWLFESRAGDRLLAALEGLLGLTLVQREGRLAWRPVRAEAGQPVIINEKRGNNDD